MIIGIDASRAGLSNRTGTENYSYNLIRALAKIDKDNRYVLYFREAPLYPIVTAPNFTSKVLPSPKLWTQARLALDTFVSSLDVLFVPAHTIPIIRKPGLRTVVTIHDLGEEFLPGYHQFPHKYYLSFTTKYAARHATQLIAVSRATKSDLVKRYHIPKEKISVVYEGINTGVYKKSAAAEITKVTTKYAISGKYIFFVGTIQPRKNLERLISAFAQNVHEGKLVDVTLVIAGGSGWLNKEIYAAPSTHDIQDRVKFLGFVPAEDLSALYSGASVFAYPSLFEGFGLPILEAFATETPVLTSNTTSIPEVAGNAALLVDPLDTTAISNGLYDLVEDKKLRDDLIKKGKQRVKAFTWEKAAKQTLDVLLKAGKRYW